MDEKEIKVLLCDLYLQKEDVIRQAQGIDQQINQAKIQLVKLRGEQNRGDGAHDAGGPPPAEGGSG
ncbi:MAG: hypothetical protein ACYSW7_11815, partial [Planctomycetota bacterium]